jgi:cytochrome P450
MNIMVREALSDTTITSTVTEQSYFLAKGNYVQLPTATVHQNPNIWGQDVTSFNPRRFIKSKSDIPTSSVFLPWGMAPHMCPARQFASGAVMIFVALMVLRFEIEQPGGGQLKMPQLLDGILATFMPPKGDVNVRITRRPDWQGRWKLELGESSIRIPLASG